MSTVEAAASLFGSDADSGPDPFAVIGNEVNDTTPPQDAPKHAEQLSPTSSYPFQMGQDASSLFAEQVYPDAQQDQHDPWSIPTAQRNASGQSHPQTGVSSSYNHQGHHSESAGYESAYVPQPVAQTLYGNTSTTYEPYRPAPSTGYQLYNTSQYPTQQYAASQTSYEPYKPTNTNATSGSSTHASQQPATIQPAIMPAQPPEIYDNRQPAARSVSSPYSPTFPVTSKPPISNGTPHHTTRTASEFRPKISNAYDPPLPPPKLHRTASPSSIRSFAPPQGVASHTPYAPLTNPPMNSYEVKSVSGPPRTMSPSSIRSASPVSDPYAPSKGVPAYATSQFRNRSASNGSTMSSSSTRDVQSPRKEYGLGFGAHIGEPSSYGSLPAQPVEQHVLAPPTTRLPYAPSPSLLGSNDTLGRTGSRAPIVSFGFGGKILTCFHGSSDLNTGFDVALSTRRTTNVAIRVLHKMLPEYASDTKVADYPGPLFSDPGSPVTSLVRAGSQGKTKKARVIKYLEERAEEISRGTMYISDNLERQRLDGKLTLVQLLRIMVENDGSLSGSPSIDNAVRTALLPRIAGTLEEPSQDASLSPPTFVSPMRNGYDLSSMHHTSNEAPMSLSTLLPATLDKIQEHLIRGERRQAYHYALDQKLWTHAMIIASSIDKEAWKEVVNEFLRVELGAQQAKPAIPHVRGRDALPPQTNGREWLRVAYSVFSGQGPTAVRELVSPNLLSRTATTGLHVPAPILSQTTPMSPSFPSTTTGPQIPPETLAYWPEIVASIVSSPLNPECSAALSALGDSLASHHLVEAAHVCYLLSPQTSAMGGIGGPSTRMVLLGSQPLPSNPAFFKDSDPVIFSEIAEFAFSLKTPTKGQDPFHGFPHLQAYKLIRAASLADVGHVQNAIRYCEAITAAMARPSPYFTPTMVDGLKNLADRLIGSPHLYKSSSWIGGKVNKPSLDSIGSWLEVRLTKFIAGEGNESEPSPCEPSNAQFSGPFSSYSSISSATTSASPSPPPTVVSSVSATQPPRRSGSAMELPSTTMHAPIDRASSAMEYYRPVRNASPAPPKTAPLYSTGYPYAPYAAQRTTPSNVPNGYISAYGSEPCSRKTSLEMTTEEVAEPQRTGQDEPEQQQEPEDVEDNQATQDSDAWWNSLSNADSVSTPTATKFHQVEDARELGDGFISLMDDPSLSVTPSASSPSYRRMETSYEHEQDDLGLGNSSFKKKQEEPAKPTQDKPQAPAASSQEPPKSTEKQDAQPAAPSGGSWLSRFWKRSDTPGPVKASLGEETSFYYDKELKRWVNNKAGAEAPQAQAPPPPPSRAQTASPTVCSSRPNGIPNGMAGPPQPPPPRTASAIDLTTSPTAKVPMRVRSNLVPTEIASMQNTRAPDSSPGVPPPPPMGRSRSQAAKKNARSRYVDVFQQDGSAGGV